MTMEDKVNYFKTEFAKRNPPPEPGTFPIKLDQVVLDHSDIDECHMANRWPCRGGPMDGQGIAKSIQLKKGAGKKKLYVTIPTPLYVEVRNEEGSIDGTYKFNGEEYNWIDDLPIEEESKDVFNSEYWERLNEKD